MIPLFPLKLKRRSKSRLGYCIDDKMDLKRMEHVPPTKLPPRDSKYDMTLIWDLDETLVSSKNRVGEKKSYLKTYFTIRPYALETLDALRTRFPNVEMIVWTAADSYHADTAIASIGFDFDYI